MFGLLFAQARSGADHFAEAWVSLDADAHQLEVQAVGDVQQRHFSRGLDLKLVRAVRLSERRGVFVLALEEAERSVHFVAEDKTVAEEWHRALQSAVVAAGAHEALWAQLLCASGPRLSLPTSSSIPEFPADFARTPRNGRLPLHALCATGASSGDAEAALRTLLAAYPAAAETRSAAGALPLHLLLASAPKPRSPACSRWLASVERLVGAHPDSVLEPFRGGFPIHQACATGVDGAVQLVLAVDCPRRHVDDFLGEAGGAESDPLRQVNARKETPLHVLLRAHQRQPLAQSRALCVLVAALDANVLLEPDADGATPLHVAADAADDALLRALLDFPVALEAATRRDQTGRLPLDILQARTSSTQIQRCINILNPSPPQLQTRIIAIA